MKLNKKEEYVSPALLIVEVKVGRSLLTLSNPEGEGHGFTGWD